MKKEVKGHASDHFCSLLMRALIKLFHVIKNHLPNAHAYADDTELYLSLKPDSSMSETEARGAMERCIRTVRAWLIVDNLKLNKV